MGGLVMMRSTPVGKACVKSSGVMVLASMGRRPSQSSIASWGSRRGCLALTRASLCEVAECAAGSMSTNVYEATECPDLRMASRPVAIPPQISTRWVGLWGRMYLGVSARAGFGGGLEGRGGSLGGVRGNMAAGQTGKGLMGRSAGGV
jgi:hypothetical protein